jgi:hypothetical protein
MALCRTVVSTTIGVEGLPVEDRVHYFGADDPIGFARALTTLADKLAAGDRSIEAMTTVARQAVSPFFWPRIVAELSGLYRQAAAREELRTN